MRRLLILLVALVTLSSAEAQTLWGELSPQEQRATIMSRRTPDVVREVMLSPTPLKELDYVTRDRLIAKVTSRCGDENLAALYLYIYNTLREPNGSMAESDVRMLSMHTLPIFKLWSNAEESEGFYNWAYSIAYYAAASGEAKVKRVFKKLTNKKMAAIIGDSASRFIASYHYAYSSVKAGLSAFNDVTPLAPLCDTFTADSEETYANLSGQSSPIMAAVSEQQGDVEKAMRRECMAWGGGYHTQLKQNIGRGVSLIFSERADGEYVTIADAHGDSYTFRNEVFMLDDGYFVAIKRNASFGGIVVGKLLQRGGFVLFGERNLDYDTKILGVKCEGRSIYLHVERKDKNQSYLNFTIR